MIPARHARIPAAHCLQQAGFQPGTRGFQPPIIYSKQDSSYVREDYSCPLFAAARTPARHMRSPALQGEGSLSDRCGGSRAECVSQLDCANMFKKIGMLSLRGDGVHESFGLGLQQRLHTVVALGGEVHGHHPGSPGAMTIRWTGHPKTNGIRETSVASAAAWQPSATQVQLWKTPHGEATSGFVQYLTLSNFRRCPVRGRCPFFVVVQFSVAVQFSKTSNFPKIGIHIYVQFSLDSRPILDPEKLPSNF